MLVVGKREMEEGSVNIRRFGSQQQRSSSFEEAFQELVSEATPPDLRR